MLGRLRRFDMELTKELDLSNKSEWSDVISILPDIEQDVHLLPEYYQQNQVLGNGEPICFLYEKEGNIAIYPFLKNSVNDLNLGSLRENYFDIQGPSGYNGVATNSKSPDFIQDFSQAFTEYCLKNNIIAEFVRFNPILGNHKISGYIKPVKANKNIVVDLSLSEEDIWSLSFEHSVRKNVKKAQRNGLVVECFRGSEIPDNWIDTFHSIYINTMKRQFADTTYFFSIDYFRSFKNTMPDNTLFFFTVKDEKAVSCELVTFNKKVAYSFLGGTLSEYFSLRPNDILKYEAILQLKERGLDFYCLGGGQTIDDGILKYKKGFCKNGEVDFFIGKKIHNKIIYEQVCENWETKYPEKNRIYYNMLLKYRQ